MRLSLPRNSLTIRLGATVALCFFVTSLIVSTGMIYSAFQKRNAERVLEMEAAANVLAASLSMSIAEADRSSINRTLRSVRYFDWIDAVEVYDNNDQQLAALGLRATLVPEEQSLGLFGLILGSDDPISFRTEVVHRGKVAGYLNLAGQPLSARNSLADELWYAALLSLLAALIGGALAILSQRSMLRPIVQLADAMDTARKGQAAPARLAIESKGEVGVLVDAYNRMTETIATRDQQLSRHRDQLETEVAERTSELKEARLVAERASEAKSRFLATMSHEIRTPMNGVLVMSELLARSKLPPTQHGYASLITRSGKALLNLLNDILDFSKIEAGRLELERISFGVDELIDDVAMLFWQRAQEKNVSLIPQISPDVPAQVMGDPTRLRQCLSNLVGNAVKFTEAGSVEITVGWDSTTPENGTLLIEVKDTGEGIPADRLDSIFEAFVQADETTTRNFGGTGLGLAITRQLAEAMGGNIKVASTLGQGSSFTIHLPIDIAQAAPLRRFDIGSIFLDLHNGFERKAMTQALSQRGIAISDNPAQCDARIVSMSRMPQRKENDRPVFLYWRLGEAEPTQFFESGLLDDLMLMPSGRLVLDEALERIAEANYRGIGALDTISAQSGAALPVFPGARVLVADDNQTNRIVIEDSLSLLDVDVRLAENGAEALRILQEERFDLILLDGEMPVMDGYQCVEGIRNAAMLDRDGRMVRTLLFSATPAEPAQLEAAGFDGSLVKPFELKQLADVLEDQLLIEGVYQTAVQLEVPVKPAPAEAEEDEILDAGTLATLRALDTKRPGTLQKVIDRFSADLPGNLDRIEEAAKAGDAAQLAKAAHGFKSMSMTVGAAKLARRCNGLETGGREHGVLPSDADLSGLRHLALQSEAMLREAAKAAA